MRTWWMRDHHVESVVDYIKHITFVVLAGAIAF